MSSLGYGQTWQAVTRTLATTYYNTTGRPITVSCTYNFASGSTIITVGGAEAAQSGGGTLNEYGEVMAVVPPGMSYVISVNATNTIINVKELR